MKTIGITIAAAVRMLPSSYLQKFATIFDNCTKILLHVTRLHLKTYLSPEKLAEKSRYLFEKNVGL
jgi:hypothetical protein